MANPWFRSNGPLWMTAVVAGLIVMMLIAVLSPRMFATEEPGWVVSVSGGILVAAAIVVWGYSKRRSGDEEDHPPAQ